MRVGLGVGMGVGVRPTAALETRYFPLATSTLAMELASIVTNAVISEAIWHACVCVYTRTYHICRCTCRCTCSHNTHMCVWSARFCTREVCALVARLSYGRVCLCFGRDGRAWHMHSLASREILTPAGRLCDMTRITLATWQGVLTR